MRQKITITKSYTIDVLHRDPEEAKRLAEAELDQAMLEGREHYYQEGDTEMTTYDVTNTDDPFNPIND